MKHSTKGVFVLAAVALLSLFAWQQTSEAAVLPVQQRLLPSSYLTTTTRTNGVTNLCTANLNRSTLVNQADVTAAATMIASVNTAIGLDG